MTDAPHIFIDLPSSSARLVPVDEDDTPLLFSVAAAHGLNWLRMLRYGLPPIADFQEQLWDGVLAHYFVVLADEALAYTACYGPDMMSGSAFVEFVPIRDVNVGSATWRSIQQDVVSLYRRTWGLRRLMNEYADGHGPALTLATPVGRCSDELFAGGRYVDRIVAIVGEYGS